MLGVKRVVSPAALTPFIKLFYYDTLTCTSKHDPQTQPEHGDPGEEHHTQLWDSWSARHHQQNKIFETYKRSRGVITVFFKFTIKHLIKKKSMSQHKVKKT